MTMLFIDYLLHIPIMKTAHYESDSSPVFALALQLPFAFPELCRRNTPRQPSELAVCLHISYSNHTPFHSIIDHLQLFGARKRDGCDLINAG